MIDPLLSAGGSYAYWNGYQNANLEVPEPLSLYVETDRPIYRPGQDVKYKVTAILREPRGFRAYDGKNKLRITVRDQNWQELFRKDLPFTGLGSASGDFTIPQGRLLGQYSITAELQEYGRNFSGVSEIRVEEYKRPEFEVKLAAAEAAFKYGQPAKVEGTVKYYFGSPVPGAQFAQVCESAGRYWPHFGQVNRAPRGAIPVDLAKQQPKGALLRLGDRERPRANVGRDLLDAVPHQQCRHRL